MLSKLLLKMEQILIKKELCSLPVCSPVYQITINAVAVGNISPALFLNHSAGLKSLMCNVLPEDFKILLVFVVLRRDI